MSGLWVFITGKQSKRSEKDHKWKLIVRKVRELKRRQVWDLGKEILKRKRTNTKD